MQTSRTRALRKRTQRHVPDSLWGWTIPGNPRPGKLHLVQPGTLRRHALFDHIFPLPSWNGFQCDRGDSGGLHGSAPGELQRARKFGAIALSTWHLSAPLRPARLHSFRTRILRCPLWIYRTDPMPRGIFPTRFGNVLLLDGAKGHFLPHGQPNPFRMPI